MSTEPFDGVKWIKGFFDLTRWTKDLATLLRILVWFIVAFALLVGTVKIKNWLFPKDKPVAQNTAITGDTNKVENVGTKNNKWGLLVI